MRSSWQMSWRVLLFVIAASHSAIAQSQVHLKFDMGSSQNSTAPSGWTLIGENSGYSSGTGHGWLQTNGLSGVQRSAIPAFVVHNGYPSASVRDNLLIDHVAGAGDLVFCVDVASGQKYDCIVTLGDVGGSTTSTYTPLGSLKVGFCWGSQSQPQSPLVADGIHARTLLTKGQVDLYPFVTANGNTIYPSGGGYATVRFTVDVPSNETQIRIWAQNSAPSTAGPYNAIQSIEVFSHVKLPIYFDMQTKQLAAAPWVPTSTAVDTFLADFNAFSNPTLHNTSTLRQDAHAITATGLEAVRACALLWVAGWLEKDEDALVKSSDLSTSQMESALQEALTILSGLNADDSAVARMMDEAKSLDAALKHDRARGYTKTTFPTPNAGDILKNLGAAEQLYRQINGDMTAPSDHPAIETSPLLARASFRRAVQYFGRATMAPANDPNQSGFVPNIANYWHDIVKGLLGVAQTGNPLTTVSPRFPFSDELKVFQYCVAKAAADPDFAVTLDWDGVTTPTGLTPSNAWWSSFVAASPGSAPAWASALRRYLFAFSKAAKWWMDRRRIDIELGGGDGDDPEGFGLLWFIASVYSPDTDELVESDLERGLRIGTNGGLFGPSIDPALGYYKGIGDVEHAAEFTTNPIASMLTYRYGDPTSLNTSMRCSKNARNSTANSWVYAPGGSTYPDFWHFHTWNFGSTGWDAGSPVKDIPLNMRALVPTLFLEAHNGSAEATDTIQKLANSWYLHCLNTTGTTRPHGLPPYSVNLGAFPVTYGTGSQWWSNGYADDPQYVQYIYSLLLSAYRSSARPGMTPKDFYLEPIYESAKWMMQHSGDADTGIGSTGWIVKRFRGPVLNSFYEAREELYKNVVPPMTTPDTNSYDQTDMDAHLATFGSPFVNWITTSTSASPTILPLQRLLDKAGKWIENFAPLGTSAVAYNDRMWLFRDGSHQQVFAAMTGSIHGDVPQPVITWYRPTTASSPLDVAPLVVKAGRTELIVAVHNFNSSSTDIGMQLWNRLEFGTYNVVQGPDANGDFVADSTSSLGQSTYAAPGATLVFNVGANQTSIVKLTLSGQGSVIDQTTRPDVAVAHDDVYWDSVEGKLYVRVHNVGGVAVPTTHSVNLEVRDASTSNLLYSASTSGLAAPTNLAPSTHLFSITASTLPSAIRVIVGISGTPTLEQRTAANDVVIVDAVSFVQKIGSGTGNEVTLHFNSPARIGNSSFSVTATTSQQSGECILNAAVDVDPGAGNILQYGFDTSKLLWTFNSVSGPLQAGSCTFNLASTVFDPYLVGQTLYFRSYVRRTGNPAVTGTSGAFAIKIAPY